MALSAPTASAVTINLDDFSFADGGQDDFTDGFVNEGDVAVAEDGSVSITFSNIVTADGPAAGRVDLDGPFFSFFRGQPLIASMDLVFSEDVIIDSVDIDFGSGSSGMFFQLSGVNGTSGQIAVDVPTDVPFDMGTIGRFRAGEAYTLTHNAAAQPNANRVSGFFQIEKRGPVKAHGRSNMR
jgi:hypothetical protein